MVELKEEEWMKGEGGVGHGGGFFCDWMWWIATVVGG